MPSRGRCWPPTPEAPGSSASISAEGLYLTRVFSGPRGKREYRLEDEPRAVAVGYGAVWVVDSRRSRQPGAAHRPGHRRGHQADALPQLLADRRSRRRPWQRLGRGLVHRNALPDRPSLGTRDGTDRPRGTRRPTRWWCSARSGSACPTREVTRSSSTLGRSTSYHLGCCPPERGYVTAGHGSIWRYDMPTGTRRAVGRSDPSDSDANVHVTDPPFYDGLCLTSIAAGAGAVWVTVAAEASNSYTAAEPPAAAQPASAHPQPPLSPGGHACLGRCRPTRGGEKCAGS